MNCRHCDKPLEHVFVDLDYAPHSNAYLKDLNTFEYTHPLKVYVCDGCWLVQTKDNSASTEHFNADYAYFSSVSSTWLKHASDYVDIISKKLMLNQESHVVELASNDGYLLKNFVSKGIPCLGIEPTSSTAQYAIDNGVPTLVEFFGSSFANELLRLGKQADLIIGNNVYAHVPDINDFTKGMKILLKSNGTITLEFPHLLQLISNNQFDTIYHEHYSYLSLTTVRSIFRSVGLDIYDVDEIPTHGGSLRVYGGHSEFVRDKISLNVTNVLNEEEALGLNKIEIYNGFQDVAEHIKLDLLSFLLESKRNGKKVAAYGAAAKGNTLLNFGGVGKDLISKVYDAAPSKIGKYLPGSHIPIVRPDQLKEYKPDYVIIFPWNIKNEVMEQNDFIRDWGGQFVIFIPRFQLMP